MRVKRYVVDSMPDALQKIRTDLGKDAVILNTKEIRTGGFLGLFGKKKIEVIAAIDGANTNSGGAAQRFAPQPQPQQQKVMSQEQPARIQSHYSDFPDVPDVIAPVSAKKELVTVSTSVETQKSFASQQSYSPVSVNAPNRVILKDEHLMEELKQMKEMMRKLTHASEETNLPEPIQKIEHRLIEQEVDPALVRQIMDEVVADFQLADEPVTDESALQVVRTKLGQVLQSDRSKQISPQTRVVHFVGPTGVGKTTTIAKLAAEQVLKYQRKVGFITSDTYRIAAIEQLKTYGTILNVPLEVVFSPQDLAKAFHNLAECDVIFMDTAGRNFRNEMYVSELNSLLKTQGNSETILVLSLTTKYRDMRAITNNFNKFKLDKVLFTKMDETDSYGAIVNVVHEFSLQLSYVTNGQSVPDDITEMNEWQIIDLLLEEPRA
ncbi:flagellar biosynthesis protein FlhF [Paenibacillus alginolyticus]|uniref:Flagellar biosynthesis protein FlhF n=1 Tax=Paenibacillus alginolyticus TaxID=59839 RepID=A0ABT4GMB1_9BACL|nr:flagellar biosynthesis protein FlhF [Paenibacillus alginolyticus]MCY9665255.1 flagellar biosynthesis protein FlhF [Paenibacillus alginolyticus]MCY9697285.1 flagellar biosynthesis protein FlhF [Paenibacillus alginolyticus]MEC0143923.1 flagellar biosynthesis protein FlhF [Paenibacillus alginolyticus]